MAIRDIVTRGFGNGVYSPGNALIPTRGFDSAVPPSGVTGPVLLDGMMLSIPWVDLLDRSWPIHGELHGTLPWLDNLDAKGT